MLYTLATRLRLRRDITSPECLTLTVFLEKQKWRLPEQNWGEVERSEGLSPSPEGQEQDPATSSGVWGAM